MKSAYATVHQTGGGGVDIYVQDGTIWLSQKNMGQQFDTSADIIEFHLKNIYVEDELLESATTEDFSVIQQEGGCSSQRQALTHSTS